MDKNNLNSPDDKRQIQVPERNQNYAHNQRQAASNIIRNQVEQIYGQQELTPAEKLARTMAEKTSTTAVDIEKTKEPEPKILPKKQKVIQPLTSADQPAAKRPIGAIDYRPNPAAKKEAKPEKSDTQGEQWKRYHSAWQNYYQKYYESYYTAAVSREFNRRGEEITQPAEKTSAAELTHDDKKAKAMHELRSNISRKAREQTKKFRKSRHFIPLASAITVVLIVLFLQYNTFIVGGVYAYVSPGNATPQETIHNPNASVTVSGESKLIIPKINVDVPAIYGIGTDEASQMSAMEKGVAHFAIPGASSVPGQVGNTVLSGHSTNDLFDTGDYKFIFAQLDRLAEKDIIYANFEGVRYAYSVTHTKVVMPTDVHELIIDNGKPMLTLITCTPLGTADKRLLVFAEQISPDPSSAKPATITEDTSSEAVMSGMAPSFLEKLFTWNW